MPHLVVLGRPSGLAGDDLTIFLILAIAFKIIQAGLLVPLMLVLMSKRQLMLQPDDCVAHNDRGWYWLLSYWSLSAGLVVITIVLNYTM
jgi:hypothetical protein